MSNFILLIIIIMFSHASAHAEVQYQEPMSKAQQQVLDIQHYIHDKEIKILTTGEQDFITLIKEESTGFPKGIAFVVPEINQPVYRQAAVSAIYDNLNDYGWTSILLTMPDDINPVFGYQQAAIENSEQAESNNKGKNDADADPNLNLKAFHVNDYYANGADELIQQDIQNRMKAAWQLAENYSGFFLVICQGKSCGWLTNLFRSESLPTPDAMVMLSAHLPQQELNDKFALELSQTEFPVLDLYQDMDNPWVTNNLNQRKKMARKNYKTDYRQRKLFSHFGYQGQQRRTIKEIYGFLTAVGM